MKKDEASQPAANDEEQHQPAPESPWLSERLTEAEIEELKQDQIEANAYLQKAYPNLKIHRAPEVTPEAQKDSEQ